MSAPVTSSNSDATQNSDDWLEDVRDALSPVTLTRLGPFDILSELGRGGQGVIYLARDTRDNSTLALKRLHARAASSTLCQTRLLREEACLQRLTHPFIVACRGLMWIADEPVLLMAGVNGLPAGEWAAVQSRSESAAATRRIVALMAQICDAVSHAHERGVLHLDLKPSNIRVVRHADGSFTPCLLDFGLAISALADSAGDDALGWSGGTTGFLAPELRADPARRPDVRCDTFGLGVLLGELLNACMLTGSDIPHFRALPSHAPGRQPATGQLAELIRRATYPDPDLRYQTAAVLAADLRNFLAEGSLQLPRLPWRARWRMARKQGRWIRPGAVMIMAGCLYLLFAHGIPGNSSAPPHHDPDLAAAQLITGLVQQAGPDRAGPRAATIDSLPTLARMAETTLADQPRVAAEVLHAVGGAYRSLWHWAEAEPLLEKSVGLFAALQQFNDPAAIDARAQYGRVLTSKRDPRAVEILREVVDTRTRVQGVDDPRTLYARVSLAYALHRAASPPSWDAAEEMFNAALRDYARILGERHRDIASCLHNFGYMRLRQLRIAEADDLYGRALAMFDELGDPDDPWRLECMHGYSSLLITRERFDAAATVLTDAIPRVRTRFGDSGVLNLLWRAGYVHAQLGARDLMQSTFMDAFATLVSLESASVSPPEVSLLLSEMKEGARARSASVPVSKIEAAWTCLPPRLRHDLLDGLEQYAEALMIIGDPAQADVIRQFIARSAP